ncbi:MAG: hypothetical protein A2Z34_10130 [Planctomycetes bacterium RBG_16_59_8]|nr:MAG: hypothetical protein A2Z34_10130 [Planctomycetes bacterium RBG_16_59_8]
MKDFFTTGDVARICEIAPKTVINYCEAGKIPSEKSRVTNYRRIPRQALLDFMGKYGIPLARLEEAESQTVLIVDDDADFVRVLRKALKTLGGKTEVLTAGDGYEALVEIGRRRPDVVILDVRMPKLDGYEVCRALRSDPELKDLKICAVSGVAEEGLEASILRSGANLFMRKPLEMKTFLSTVSGLLKFTGRNHAGKQNGSYGSRERGDTRTRAHP